MSELTDFELRKAIAENLGFIVLKKQVNDISIVDVMVKGNDAFKSLFDFNNWNDLMPLVVENKISLDWDSFNWAAFQNEFYKDGEFFDSGYQVILINPQRALAECLLKVLEAK